MERIPFDKNDFPRFNDEHVTRGWKWFMSFISEADWKARKVAIEKAIAVDFESDPSSSSRSVAETILVVKEDLISWYLYLVDVLLHEPHKYEFFQGARIVPIFKRFGADLDLLKSIGGIDKRVKDLLKKRRSEADALLFKILTALLWRRNGFEVDFIEESNIKTADMVAKKDGKSWNIECKRQSKTSEYTYRETAKRKKLMSNINKILLPKNILLDIVFHVELESLPDNYLKELLEEKLRTPKVGKLVSNNEIDINVSFIDMATVNEYLKRKLVKYGSPELNWLIGQRPIDNAAFTFGLLAGLFRVGDGEANNVFVDNISYAYGVYWKCDAKESLWAKARDIRSQVKTAMKQFNSDDTAVIHIGMETLDGPQVEKIRLEKIKETIDGLDPDQTIVKWFFCSYFQAYSPPHETFSFDETVSSISCHPAVEMPLHTRLMIVPPDEDTAVDIYHWQRPLP